jgi:hypothetical protein
MGGIGGQVGAPPPADAEPTGPDAPATEGGAPGDPPPAGGVADVPQAARNNPRVRRPARALALSP